MQQRLEAALRDTPVVLIHGPRQCGKSTLARSLCSNAMAKGGPRRYVTLDDVAELHAAKTDPRGYVERLPARVVLDEVQRAPELLVAIKMAVDERREPGRFLLTGSANVLLLPALSDSLAGRIEILRLWPLSQGEIDGSKEGDQFVDRVFATGRFAARRDAMETREELIERVVRGGFPEAVERSGERRTDWFDAYVQTITQRDVRDLANLDRLIEVPRLLSLIATRTGALLNHAELGREVGLPNTTVRRHLSLLEMVFQVVLVPAWSSNLGLRLVKSPRAYIGDTGLACALAGISAERLHSTPDLLGRMLENFVAVELLKQSGWARPRVTVHHYRSHTGQEVDLLLEDRAGKLVGVEVKAARTVGDSDFRHLRTLREAVGARFHRGVVLYTGERVLGFGEGMEAVPVGEVWGEE